MEGTYATPEELLIYQAEPKDPQSQDDPANAWREVSNYDRALSVGQGLLEDGYSLSLQLVRALHNQLLEGVRGNDKFPGQFRRTQVQIGADARFVPPPPEHLGQCLDDFQSAIQAETTIDPLVWAFMVHYQFETIHPFTDGNGRVGRLLLSLQIFQRLRLTRPWLYMSSFFERHKDEYIEGLYKVSTEGNWGKWLHFCLLGAAEQARDAVRRIDALISARDRYRQSVGESGASARLHLIIDKLFESPMMTIPGAASLTGVTYPTAQSDINRLIALQILREGPTGRRPQYFFAPEIFRIAYVDVDSHEAQ